MPWIEWVPFAIAIPMAVVFYYLFQFVIAPLPKPRWKAMFLCASAVALSALSRVFRTGALDAWAFLIFGTVGMIVAVVVIKLRGEQLMR